MRGASIPSGLAANGDTVSWLDQSCMTFKD